MIIKKAIWINLLQSNKIKRDRFSRLNMVKKANPAHSSTLNIKLTQPKSKTVCASTYLGKC